MNPKCPLISCCRIFFKKIYLTEFSTDWLTNCLLACLPACLMPSDQHNSTMARAIRLIFSLFNVVSAQKVPFGILQYVQYFHVLTSALFCVLFIFADSENVDSVVLHDSFLFVMKNKISVFGYFDYTVAFQILLDPYWWWRVECSLN